MRLCFAALLVPWLILRVVEPQRIFSRLYLAIVLVLAYFPSESRHVGALGSG